MIDRDRYFTVCTIVITRTEEAPEPRSPSLWLIGLPLLLLAASLAVLAYAVGLVRG